MKFVAFSIMYICFYGLIAAAVYWTESAWPLLALLLTPGITTSTTPTEGE